MRFTVAGRACCPTVPPPGQPAGRVCRFAADPVTRWSTAPAGRQPPSPRVGPDHFSVHSDCCRSYRTRKDMMELDFDIAAEVAAAVAGADSALRFAGRLAAGTGRPL